ncbi:MAG: TetR/AcrR family transcriptional regulator [Streptosporangiales bacterium]
MVAIRHSPDRVLDAARDCVLQVGVRRTTLTDVARRAGTSRMTLYRRYPDVSALVADLMTREFGSVLERARGAGDGLVTARERAVAEVVAAVRALRGNRLFVKVLEVDPELLLPYVLERLGSTQRLALALFESVLEEGYTDGSVRRGEPAAMAYALLLTVQSFVLSMRTVVDGSGEDVMYAELRHLLATSLRPDEEGRGG